MITVPAGEVVVAASVSLPPFSFSFFTPLLPTFPKAVTFSSLSGGVPPVTWSEFAEDDVSSLLFVVAVVGVVPVFGVVAVVAVVALVAVVAFVGVVAAVVGLS